MYRIKIPPYNIGSADSETRLALVDAARQYVGVRFLHLGRNRAGLDCVGLLLRVHADVTGQEIVIEGYSNWPSTMVMRKLLNEIMVPISRTELGVGDAMFLKNGSRVHHLGIYTGSTLIHASNAPGTQKVTEVTFGKEDHRKIMGCYAFPIYEDEKCNS